MLHRRRFLALSAAAAGLPAAVAAPLPAPASVPGAAGPWRLLQPMDQAADQQEQVRDYAAGLQAAVQAANRAGGLQGREVQVQPWPMEARADDLKGLVQRLRGDASLLGLAGTCGERLALAVVDALADAALVVPHVAPWLADSRHDARSELVNLFASRETQVRKTLDSLAAMGLRQIGVVYDGERTRASLLPGIDDTLRRLSLTAPAWTAPASGGVEALVRQLPPDAPPVLAFAGGALELARLAKALAQRPMQRYLVALAEADLGLLSQLGVAGTVPVVLTQVVPNPRAGTTPLVRRYRDLQAQLYDDEPTPQGLAGYLAGRYLLRLLERSGARSGRQALLDETRLRAAVDVDGFALGFNDGSRRGSRFVTQVLLGRDGRLIG